MKKELDEALCRDFPLTFRDRNASKRVTCMCWGFPGDGWEPIIRKACEKIEPILAAMAGTRADDEMPRASQVKEKFGGLRFYFDGGTDEIYAILHEAENESCKTCEDCGSKENVTCEGSWVLTLCKACRKK